MRTLRFCAVIMTLAIFSAIAYIIHLCTAQPNQLQWTLWVTATIAALLMMGGFLGAVGLFGFAGMKSQSVR